MKPKAILRLLLACFALTVSVTASYSQDSLKKVLPIAEYQQMVSAIREGNVALDQIAAYKFAAQRDSIVIAALMRERTELKATNVSLVAATRDSYQERDAIRAQMLQKDEVITNQKVSLAKLSTRPVKHFGLGWGAGYGYNPVNGKRGPVVSFILYHSVARF